MDSSAFLNYYCLFSIKFWFLEAFKPYALSITLSPKWFIVKKEKFGNS